MFRVNPRLRVQIISISIICFRVTVALCPSVTPCPSLFNTAYMSFDYAFLKIRKKAILSGCYIKYTMS